MFMDESGTAPMAIFLFWDWILCLITIDLYVKPPFCESFGFNSIRYQFEKSQHFACFWKEHMIKTYPKKNYWGEQMNDSKGPKNGLLGILMATNEWFMRPKKNSCEYYGNKQISNLWEQWWEQINKNLWEHGWQTCRRKSYLQTCKRNWNLANCNRNLNLQTARRILNLQNEGIWGCKLIKGRDLKLQTYKRKGFEFANL